MGPLTAPRHVEPTTLGIDSTPLVVASRRTGSNRNEEDVDGVVDTHHSRSSSDLADAQAMRPEADARIDFSPATPQGEPSFDVLGGIARLEASAGAALTLLRRCIVEQQAPTREALAAEAEFAFGMPAEVALAEIDEIAEMMGISSLR
jgi:hypothetical protein